MALVHTHGSRGRPSQNGVSLLIVLVMVLVIGMTSVAAIRSATNSEKVATAVRSEKVAQQYAEAALRYCEGQLQLADSDANRVASLKEAMITQTTAAVTAAQRAWEQSAAWTGTAGAGAASSRTIVPEAFLKSTDSSYYPNADYRPQCLVEAQTYPANPGPGSRTGLLVTARAFSPNYKANSNNTTETGSVVWVQSLIFLE